MESIQEYTRDLSSTIYYKFLNLYYDTEYYAYQIKTYLFN